jgi:UDP-glucose 4-epimerase
MKFFLTGGAGFIGSHMTDRLLKEGHQVTVFDNLSNGTESRIAHHLKDKNFRFVKGDLLKKEEIIAAIKGHDFVIHFASNPDIAKAIKEPDIDIRLGIMTAFNVLDAMRVTGVAKIAFPSGSGVYGDVGETKTAEDFGPLLPISMYGASKLSVEALISAFCNQYDMQGWIFRFANIIGPRQTHGVTLDFVKKLKANPKELTILGDGTQSKSYVYVTDIIDAMLFCIKKSTGKVNLYNVATSDFISVNEIAKIVVEEMKLKDVKFDYTGGNRGWKGDVPIVRFDVSKLAKLGWKVSMNSGEAVRKTVKDVIAELQ